MALGVGLIMWPHNLWLSYVAGSQLIMLAVLRIFTIFRMSPNAKDEGLLPEFDDNAEKYGVFMYKYDKLLYFDFQFHFAFPSFLILVFNI